MLKISYKNDNKTEKFLERIQTLTLSRKALLEKYGELGVEALSSNTPVRTGLTARSWYYRIEEEGDTISLSFYNSNIQNGVKIALILDVGHGTKQGIWIEGRKYIDKSITPVFDELKNKIWGEVIDNGK